MKKNVKNVAYIQDPGLLTQEQIKKYMGDVKNLTSFNTIEIYNFIVCCNKCYKITNFCLSINSQSLSQLNPLIKNNRKLQQFQMQIVFEIPLQKIFILHYHL